MGWGGRWARGEAGLGLGGRAWNGVRIRLQQSRQQDEGMAAARPARTSLRLGHLPRRAPLRLRDPRRAGQSTSTWLDAPIGYFASWEPRRQARRHRRDGCCHAKPPGRRWQSAARDVPYFRPVVPAMLHFAGYRPPSCASTASSPSIAPDEQSCGTFITARSYIEQSSTPVAALLLRQQSPAARWKTWTSTSTT